VLPRRLAPLCAALAISMHGSPASWNGGAASRDDSSALAQVSSSWLASSSPCSSSSACATARPATPRSARRRAAMEGSADWRVEPPPAGTFSAGLRVPCAIRGSRGAGWGRGKRISFLLSRGGSNPL
jgi:hypothetical protein